jgi:predicted CXXCH cytochrome family protein
MNDPCGTGSHDTRCWRRWTAASALLMGVLLLIWTGCSPAKNYKLLSLFFDGVPDPNAPVAKGNAEEEGLSSGGATVKQPILATHKPFSEGKCSSCHKEGAAGSFDMGSLSTEICLQCHDKVLHEHPLMHGPVAVKSCLWCHNPHESSYASLMRGPAAEVCGQCHESGLLGPNPPEHRTGKSNCVECHSGHGGNARFFLIKQTSLATRPALAPDNSAATQPKEGAP